MHVCIHAHFLRGRNVSRCLLVWGVHFPPFSLFWLNLVWWLGNLCSVKFAYHEATVSCLKSWNRIAFLFLIVTALTGRKRCGKRRRPTLASKGSFDIFPIFFHTSKPIGFVTSLCHRSCVGGKTSVIFWQGMAPVVPGYVLSANVGRERTSHPDWCAAEEGRLPVLDSSLLSGWVGDLAVCKWSATGLPLVALSHERNS